jgi:hypothetical protein
LVVISFLRIAGFGLVKLCSILSTTVEKWKQFKYSLADEWKNKMWCLVTMEYYSSIKKNEIDQVWWYTAIISVLGRLRQKDHKFKVSLGYVARLSQKKF